MVQMFLFASIKTTKNKDTRTTSMKTKRNTLGLQLTPASKNKNKKLDKYQVFHPIFITNLKRIWLPGGKTMSWTNAQLREAIMTITEMLTILLG